MMIADSGPRGLRLLTMLSAAALAVICWSTTIEAILYDKDVDRTSGGGYGGCNCLRWTNWISADTPSDSGDWETLGAPDAHGRPGTIHHVRPDICTIPVRMECRTVQDQTPWYQTGEKISYECNSQGKGFACLNKKQVKGASTYGDEYKTSEVSNDYVYGKCRDYEVRVLCFYTGYEECNCLYWTKWYNSDNPTTGEGDEELIGYGIPKYVCEGNYEPVDVQCKTVAGLDVFHAGNKNIKCDLRGLSCYNYDQGHNCKCHDYEVRFLCPRFSSNYPVRAYGTGYEKGKEYSSGASAKEEYKSTGDSGGDIGDIITGDYSKASGAGYKGTKPVYGGAGPRPDYEEGNGYGMGFGGFEFGLDSGKYRYEGGEKYEGEKKYRGSGYEGDEKYGGGGYEGGEKYGGGGYEGGEKYGGVKYEGGEKYGGGRGGYGGGEKYGGGEQYGGVGYEGDAKYEGGEKYGGAKYEGGDKYEGAGYEGSDKYGGAKYEGGEKYGGAKYEGGEKYGGAGYEGGAKYEGGEKYGGAKYEGGEKYGGAGYEGGEKYGGAGYQGGEKYGGSGYEGGAKYEGGEKYGGAGYEGSDKYGGGGYEGGEKYGGEKYGGSGYEGGSSYNYGYRPGYGAGYNYETGKEYQEGSKNQGGYQYGGGSQYGGEKGYESGSNYGGGSDSNVVLTGDYSKGGYGPGGYPDGYEEGYGGGNYEIPVYNTEQDEKLAYNTGDEYGGTGVGPLDVDYSDGGAYSEGGSYGEGAKYEGKSYGEGGKYEGKSYGEGGQYEGGSYQQGGGQYEGDAYQQGSASKGGGSGYYETSDYKVGGIRTKQRYNEGVAASSINYKADYTLEAKKEYGTEYGTGYEAAADSGTNYKESSYSDAAAKTDTKQSGGAAYKVPDFYATKDVYDEKSGYNGNYN